jgi:NAD(P)-dependent dehydrogenase (short-subunit alcohol dehydrogenase family)
MNMTTIDGLMDMSGRVALVTGATGVIGHVIAETLAELGANLVLVDKPGSSYELLVESITSRWPVRIDVRACDLEAPDERTELITGLRSSISSLDVLVNNAAFVGTSDLDGWSVPFEEQSLQTWRRALEVNLTAAFDLSKGLAPLLRQSAHASILNIGSIYGSLGPDYSLYDGTSMGNPAAYAVSKGGLIQFSRWLATTLAPTVRVNVISPGGLFRRQPDSFVKRYEARTPLGRMATNNDLRGAIAYLASDLSAYVTGQELRIDGGWSAW